MTGLGEARIARRYATALFGVARKLGTAEAVQHDLDAIVEARRESPALTRVLESPLVSASEKHAMLDRALAGVDDVTRAFIHLLVNKRRTDVLPAIYEEYVRCADEAAGVARAYVTTAAPLSGPLCDELSEALTRHLGRPVQMHFHVEPALLGGVSVRVGDMVWDGSVRGALETMREQILAESAMAEMEGPRS